jgi:hypothetical protein
MFDNAPSSSYGKKLGNKHPASQGAVYGELKLSDQLNAQLQVIRDEVNRLTENLEMEVNLRSQMAAQLRETQKKYML